MYKHCHLIDSVVIKVFSFAKENIQLSFQDFHEMCDIIL